MRIAVTGGIAEGKSTVLAMLQDAGYRTLSSDHVAREVFEESEVQHKLAKLSGLSLPVQPEALRDRIYEQPDLRREVNALTHPRILERLRGADADFIEVPLLIEACLQGEFDRVWVVTCGPREQLRRLADRVKDRRLARSMLNSQLPTGVKSVFADLIVRTNQPAETVRKFVTMEASSAFGRAGSGFG